MSSSEYGLHVELVNGKLNTGKGNLRKRNLESLLNCLQYLLIGLAADERDRPTPGTETTCTADTMEVGISTIWEIVVDGEIDTLDINTTTKDVCGNADTLVEILELLVALDTVVCQ